jgi:3'-5' exoribonuclease
MRKQFVVDIKADEEVQSLFLVRDREIRSVPATGKNWLLLTLMDRTGAISGKMWDSFEAIFPALTPGIIVRVKARSKDYRNVRELTIQQITPVTSGEYDLADFLPHTKFNIDEMFAKLRSIVTEMRNRFLRQLNLAVLDDPDLSALFKRSPAATSMHHAYIGGLLEHVLSLCELTKLVAGHYPEVDLDLVLTVAVLHDMGKTAEISPDAGFAYTTEGKLLGHLFISLKMARAKMDTIPGFPPALATVVEHLIASHHGTLAFGAIREPMIREAVLFHMLDDMDAKMAAIRAAHEGTSIESGDWTEKVWALGQKPLLRAETFLKATAEAPAPSSPTLFPIGAPERKTTRGGA